MEWVAFSLAAILSGFCVLAALGAAFAAGKLDAIRASKIKVDQAGGRITVSMILASIFMAIGVWIVVAS